MHSLSTYHEITYLFNARIACLNRHVVYSSKNELLFPTELTNLIIIRNSSSVEAQESPAPERNGFSHIQFHMIKYEDLKWVSVLYQYYIYD